jgi:hypothetical protein
VRALTRVVLALAALGLVRVAAESRSAGIVANTVMVSVLAVLVVRSRRTDLDLKRTRTWMLAALLTGVAAGVAAAVDQALRPHAGYPRAGDVVEILYVPCTLMALLAVPLKGVRRGFRVRAISDGLVAASSLLFLLEPWLDGVARAHTGPAAVVVAFGIPLGGVFIVATALTALARCSDEARPMLVWLVLGISMMAAADLVYAVSPDTHPGLRRALLQVGLTTLVGAAVARRGSSSPSLEEMPRALGVLPFLPFVGAVGLSTTYVLAGQGLTQDQLVLAIAIGLALVLRQYVGSRDKTRLVEELEQREVVLQQELRVDRLTGVATASASRRPCTSRSSRAAASGSSSSTSTTSSSSTTTTGTPSATRSCGTSPSGCAAGCARATSSPGSAGTSSRCSSTGRPTCWLR